MLTVNRALVMALAIAGSANAADLRFKDRLLSRLVESVPGMLGSFDRESGRFGTGIWICRDQEVMYPLATFGLKDKGPGQWRINCHRVVRDQQVESATWNLEPGPWHEPLNGSRQPFGRLTFQ